MSRRLPLLVALVTLSAALLGWLLLRDRGETPPPPRTATAESSASREATVATPPPDARIRIEPESSATDTALSELELLPGFEADDPAVAWSRVDMDAVREALPDNLYWSLHMPTRDAALLEERQREQAGWRALRTRVESGNASEEEVDAYYAHRLQRHTDAIEFTSYLIDHYGDDFPERDLGMLHLARRLHRARLVELPRAHARAQDLRLRQEAARQAWREQQAAFATDDAARQDAPTE